MAEFNKNLWSPWRMEYIKTLDQDDQNAECFICRYWENPRQDRKHHVLWRTEHTFAFLNRFPYTGGHLLVAPAQHQGDFQELPTPVLNDMMALVKNAQKLLQEVFNPHGFNIGMNFGRCAGAGIPDHLHAHVVPRWQGDTNFMAVLSDVRLIPQLLDDIYQHMLDAAPALNLPPLAPTNP